ncbi:TetR/AcrR family transcriptional regulator [Streptomyces flavofungini]|uniref:TetR/AcrR family transcriptional regulator n=1 Tax=Streptomyces flavofungini TaxID=68200 RepID=A0ABS0X8H1_9ACTN|nr:TetR/AcrR family transcriptional regulator [Streptomyces flavofungini]MBJ3809439.1 TetR/AcrR family transcriptional regulator [Streptomyces flavofungini]GHC78287.1 TetR family transcriptional regulator [Streptomyces flavofungini]
MDTTVTAAERALDAAERLFYRRGIQSVGMDEIRTASGLSLKRLYQLFPAKERLVEAYLERRDERWRRELAEHVERHESPERRILAVFDWLGEWFAEPDFNGCAWINSYGELGATSEPVARQVRLHKAAFRDYVADLVARAGLPASLGEQVFLLAEGAMATAAITRTTAPAQQAAQAARLLITASRQASA